MKQVVAILLGKSISLISRSFKVGGGSAAPGLYALKIDPNLVEKLIKQVPTNIVITGTNGKTTTARMLSHFATDSGLRVIRNQTGSNLERGIASALISNYGRKFDLGIWELDEAAFNLVAPKIKPNIVVFLNVFRDQLDRYGEVDSVVTKWQQILKKFPKKTRVLVNGDDDNTARLAKQFSGKVKTFGVESFKIKGEGVSLKKNQAKLDFEAKDVQLRGLKGTVFKLQDVNYHLKVPGVYHIYDAVAALVVASHLGLPTQQLTKVLESYQPAFGRVEQFKIKNHLSFIFLIKNPTGATEVFKTLASEIKKTDRLLLALNDNLADGTDVSWIWDGEFENLANHKGVVITSGTRAEDLAVRLKYAGFNPKQVSVEPNLARAFRASQKGLKGRLFILPTYTAMLQLQGILANSGIKKHYWEEN